MSRHKWLHRLQRTLEKRARERIERRQIAAAAVADGDLDLALLEDRILYSASPLPLDLGAIESLEPSEFGGELADWLPDADLQSPEVHGTDSGAPEASAYGSRSPDADLQAPQANAYDSLLTDAPIERRELLVLDASVQGGEELVREFLAARQRPGVDWQLVVLERAEDGIGALTSLLRERASFDAIHVLSHAAEGGVQLGSSWLDLPYLQARSEEIAGWRGGLAPGADVLWYGCDLAAGPQGVELLQRLSELTGADVAASEDPTGNAGLGGDWDLEFQTGLIQTFSFSSDVYPAWHGLLAANQAPVNSVPGSQNVLEDGSLLLSAATGNGLSVSDADAGSAALQVTLSATHGTLTLSSQLGAEFQVNTTTSRDQMAPAVAVASDGRYVVVWQSDLSSNEKFEIFARIYAANGTPLSNEFQVNQTTKHDDVNPQVAIADDGRFVVSWEHYDSNTGNWDVYARTFSANGNPLSSEKRVNSTTADHQTNTAVGMASNGDFVVAWESANQDGSSYGVYARQFRINGNALTNEFRVNATIQDAQTSPALAMKASGEFVVTWQSKGQDGSSEGIYARRYNAAAAPLSGEVRVNSYTSQAQRSPSIAMNTLGDYLITWQSSGQDGSGEGLYGQRYAAGGGLVGGEFRINSTTAGDQMLPSVALADNGAFAVAWQMSGDVAGSSQTGIYLQEFDAAGQAVRGEQLVNTYRTNDQRAPALGLRGTSQAVVVWQSAQQDGSEYGVYGQRWQTPGQVNFSHGDGSAAATMTFSGNIAALQKALGQVVYRPDADYEGTAEIRLITNDLGNTGTGGPQSDTDVVPINVIPVNDAPLLDASGTIQLPAISEDDTSNPGVLVATLLGSRISDIDAGAVQGLAMSASSASAGEWQYSLNGGVTWSSVGSVSTSSALLLRSSDRVRFAPSGTMASTPTFHFVAWDQSAGTAGGRGDTTLRGGTTAYSLAMATATVTVAPVNDAPTIQGPASSTVNEDATLKFSLATGNAVTFADVDAGSAIVETTLSVTQGTLSLSTTTALTFLTGDGVNDTTMKVRGTLAALNSAMDQMVYAPTANYFGAAQLVLSVDDLGNSGAGGPRTAIATIPITVSPVNDAPQVTVPGPQNATEDTDFTITGLSLADIDAGTSPVQLTLSAANGQLTLATTTGLTFIAGDGTADSSLTVRGSLHDLNTAIATLVYRGQQDFNGTDTISAVINDLGNTGTPGPLSQSSSFIVSVSAVNDSPVHQLPVNPTGVENTTLIFSTENGNAISIVDVDAGGNTLEVSLNASYGLLTLARKTGLTFTAGDGASDAGMTFRGTLLNINAALNGLKFQPLANYAGPASLRISSNDLGGSGSGGFRSDLDLLSISILPDGNNRTPEIVLPINQLVLEEGSLIFSPRSGNGIYLTDDSGANAIEMTLAVTGGTVSLSSTSGAEMPINLYVAGNQQASRVAMTPDGSFVAVWQSDGQDGNDWGIFAQRFAVDGQVLGEEIRVNTTTNKAQTEPAIVAAPDGTFVVAWTSREQDGDMTGVYAQRFNSQGSKLGSEFRVNTTTTREQQSPAIAMDDSGRFAIAWQSKEQDGNGWGVYIRYYSADGTPLTGEVRANSTTAGNQQTPAIAMDADGDAVVTWQSTDGDKWGIVARRFSAAGVAVGGEIAVNAVSFKDQINSTVAMDDTGRFVVAWQSKDLDYTDGKYGIYAAAFEADGTPLPGGQFLVNTTTPDDQTRPAVAMDAEGNFVITWQGKNQDHPDGSYGIFAQRFAAGGSRVGEEFAVNSWTSRDQTEAAIAVGGDGHFVITWTSKDQDGGGNGIFAQRFKDTRNLEFLAGDGEADSLITLRGTQEELNDVLDGLQFRAALDRDDKATITITVNDLGHSGAGGPKSNSQSFDIDIEPVNDAPRIMVPVHQNLTENTPLVFSTATGNALSVVDPDIGNARLVVSMQVTGGTVTLASTNGLNFSAGDGTQDTVLTFQAKPADLQTAWEGMQFQPLAGYAGPAAITISVNDQGRSGLGGVQSDMQVITLTVLPDATNTPPVIFVPSAQRTARDVSLTLSGATGNAVTLLDDAGDQPVQLTLSATHGKLTLTNTIGTEVVANTMLTDLQRHSQLARAENGNYVVVWQSKGQDGSDEGIYAQRFAATGQKLGVEFRVNTFTAGKQEDPAVAMDAAGNFVVTWTSGGQDGDGDGVYGRRFAADGAPLGEEFLVNTGIAGNQIESAVAITATGEFVVVWESADANGSGIFAQRYDAEGVSQGAEFQVNTTFVGNQSRAAVAMDDSGRFTVVWDGPDGSGLGIFAQRFAANGTLLGPEFRVNTTTADDQETADIAMDSAGRFVVAWMWDDDDDKRIMARRFDSQGNPLGNEMGVSTLTEGESPSVTMNDNGRFVVSWTGSDASGAGVFARHFHADGTADGGSFALNTVTAEDQQWSDLVITEDDRLMATWTTGGVSHSVNVIVQQYLPPNALQFSEGDGWQDTRITVTGRLSDLNSALNGMLFTPSAGFTGVAAVALELSDLGNSGAGPVYHDYQSLAIAVGNGPRITLDANNSSNVGNGGFATTFAPGPTGVSAVDLDATLDDPNSGNLTSLTVTITNRQNGAAEVLTATTAGNILSSYSDGVLRLTGTDTIGRYQQVLRSIRYLNSDPTPGQTTREIQFVAKDDLIFSNVATALIYFLGGNTAPEITSVAQVNVLENVTNVQQVTVTDADIPAQTLTFDLAGGADQNQFTIDAVTGWLRFLAAPDFDRPADANRDNRYEVQVRVSDGQGGTDVQTVLVTVDPLSDEDPVFTSADRADVFEGTTAVLRVQAVDADLPAETLTYSLAGGADDALFMLDGASGQLAFIAAPDFSNPADADRDNAYEVTVRVDDGTGRSAIQNLTVTVRDVTDTIVVDTAADVLDGDTSSVFALLNNRGADGLISLREAVLAANHTAGANTIVLPAGVYQLTRSGAAEDGGLWGDLDVTGPLVITGNLMSDTILDGGAADRVFQLQGAALTLQNLTLRNGQAAQGGLMLAQTGSVLTLERVRLEDAAATDGGAIHAQGSTLTLVDTTVARTTASADGGGIHLDQSSLNAERVTWYQNSAAGKGGAVYGTSGGGTLHFVNTTFSQNSATAAGGALWTAKDTQLRNSTIAFNSAGAAGGIHAEGLAQVELLNTILARQTGGNTNRPLTSTGYNLEDGSSAWLPVAGDQQNVDPLLNPTLANHGGLTPVHALLPGSPALDAGTLVGAPGDDQRGIARDNSPDIGAFEATVGDLNVLVVTTTADVLDGDVSSIGALYANKGADGFISLREAILAANRTLNALHPDEIHFDLGGPGVHTILVGQSGLGALPAISEAVVIDGYTQMGARPNSLAVGSNAVLTVVLDGSLAGGGANGLKLENTSSGSTIRGLVIREFGSHGLLLDGGGSHQIQGNFIGLNASGTAARGNGLDGIRLNNSAGNQIGGTRAADRNVISGNNIHGIRLDGAGSSHNQILGNYVGTDAAGTAAVGNGYQGIWVANGAHHNQLGGSAAGAGNVVSGNGDTGIEVQDATSTDNIIQGNRVGTNAWGTAALGNQDGINVENAPRTLVGGSLPGAGNLVSGNRGNGIVVFGTSATNTVLENNVVGLNSAGTAALGNQQHGIVLSDEGDGGVFRGASSGTILRGNVISGNGSDGVHVEGGTYGNSLWGNRIGTDLTGLLALGNQRHGIYVQLGSNNDLGGTGPGEGNTIAHQATGDGVRILSGTGNRIFSNSIYGNAGLGINLGSLGVTANDPLDTDGGPNLRQNFPVLQTVEAGAAAIRIAGTLDSEPFATYRLEFFANATADASGHGEGQVFLGFVQVTTDALGSANFDLNLNVSVPDGYYITSTATHLSSGNTSEFSAHRLVVRSNSAPVITSGGGGDSATLQIDEGRTQVTTVAATDGDSDPLSYYLAGGADHSLFTIDSSSGALEFLTAPQFSSPQDAGGDNVYEVIVEVRDGQGGQDTQTLSIGVREVNEAPVSANDAYIMDEDDLLQIAPRSVLDNDHDSEQAVLSAVLVNGPAYGTLNFHSDGSFEYRPNADFEGQDSFTYRASDGLALSPTATVAITVRAKNDAPVAADDIFLTDEDQPLSVPAGTIFTNDFDVEGSTLSGVLISGPQHGSLAFYADGSFSYTPDLNYFGNDTFTYRASDGGLLSHPATVTLQVRAVNDAPWTLDDEFFLDEDDVTSGSVLDNDGDAEGDSLAVSLVQGPAHGVLTLAQDGTFTYTPVANFYGTDEFTYRVSDGLAISGETTVALRVRAVNDRPVAVDEHYTLDEDHVLHASTGILANDTDVDGDTLIPVLVAGPAHGSLALRADGSFTYVPDADFAGTDSFTYRASDGGLFSQPATVTLQIQPVNDAPSTLGDEYFLDEDTPLTSGSVLDNDRDVEGDALAVRLARGPSHGVLTLAQDGTFSYTPDANYHGPDGFTYRVSDGLKDSAETTVALRVRAVNDAPVAANDHYAIDEDSELHAGTGILANDTDVDGDTRIPVLVAGPAHGSLTLRADGTFTYVPFAEYSGPDSFTYRVTDGQLTSAVATVQLQVRPVNDAPVAQPDHFVMPATGGTLLVGAGGVLANDTDVDGPSLYALLVSGPASGSLVLRPDGSFSYQAADGFTGTDRFVYQTTDGFTASAPVPVTIETGLNPSQFPPAGPPKPSAPPPPPPKPPVEAITEAPIPVPPPEPSPVPPSAPPAPASRPSSPESSLSVSVESLQNLLDSYLTVEAEEDNSANAARTENVRLARAAGPRAPSDHRSEARESLETPEELASALHRSLHAVDDLLRDEEQMQHLSIGSVALVSSGLSAGYVVWLLRGGLLVSGMLAQLPAWRTVDPLVVLEYRGDRDSQATVTQDDESLLSLLDGVLEPQPEHEETQAG